MRLLRDLLPDHFTVIGNFDLQMPRRRNSMEFDAVVISEHGIYAVEIKGWSGVIEGDARSWYLSWGRQQNPLILTDRKAKALRDLIARHVPALPRSVFCTPVVFLPRADVKLNLNEQQIANVIKAQDVFEFFADDRLIYEMGPGAFIDPLLRQQVVDAIVPRARPSVHLAQIAEYEVEGELEGRERPYREFVGHHTRLRNRGKVRIKAYVMDPLAPPDKAKADFNRVFRDMDALCSLEDNPYVARAYETHPDRDDQMIFYLISEWVGPRNLGEYIADGQQGAIALNADTIGERWGYALHLCKAVSFMHSRSIVHRNLHPAVIYLTHEPSRVPLKVADFEYARVANLQSIAAAITRIGTQGYTAPELWLEQDYDHRVDIFALGAILYELLTMRALYRSLPDILQHEEIWKDRRRLLPCERTRRVFDRLLALEPDRRASNLDEAVALFESEPNIDF
ncbi:MAG: NERD domain-containing protein [Bradymonadaceae bacterium]|nr:NERD domain-containing protein [Lujinxingiaceae bacterium]